MRVGELTGLRWCDVDFQKREIDINHALVYYNRSGQHCTFGINDTKTPASKRVIPMTDSVKDAFLKERAYQAENGLYHLTKGLWGVHFEPRGVHLLIITFDIFT